MVVRPLQPAQILFDGAPVGLVQVIERAFRQVQLRPFGTTGSKRRRRRTKAFQQPGEPYRSDAWRPQQRQQPSRIGSRERGEVAQGVVTRSCR